MTLLHEVREILASMTRSEKAKRLQGVGDDLGCTFPGIESNVPVSGGEPCIVRTRIPVWVLVKARNLGMSEAEILQAYPTLRAEDLANAWAFYRAHREEIDQQIQADEAAQKLDKTLVLGARESRIELNE